VPRRALTLATAATLALAACAGSEAGVTTGTTAAPIPSTVPPGTDGSDPPPTQPERPLPIEWRDCDRGLECATYGVPLDWSDPTRGTVELFVKRRPAGEPDRRIGTLFANPGGPGVPGTALVDQAELQFSEDVLDRFDLLSWDPRGVGRTGEVDCVEDLDPYFGIDSTPDDDEERQALIDSGKDWGERCQQRNGDLLPYVSTQDAARDMDAIRKALGEPETSYFGFSYGSKLGATYATLFPDHVRAMVLDGASNPNAPYEEDVAVTASSLERSLDAVLAQCSADDDCAFHNGGDAEGAFDRLMADIDREPIEVEPDRPTVGHGVAYYAIVSSLYDEAFWPVLTDALADAQDGDGRALLQMYDDYLQRDADGTWTNAFESLLAINCLDDPGPQGDPSVQDELAESLRSVAPRLGDWISYSFVCTFWPVAPVPRLEVTGAGAGPIVVVGTTGDPITPLELSRQLAEEELEDGHLVTVEAERHTGYGVNRCSVDVVDAYLIDLVVPDDGVVCR